MQITCFEWGDDKTFPTQERNHYLYLVGIFYFIAFNGCFCNKHDTRVHPIFTRFRWSDEPNVSVWPGEIFNNSLKCDLRASDCDPSGVVYLWPLSFPSFPDHAENPLLVCSANLKGILPVSSSWAGLSNSLMSPARFTLKKKKAQRFGPSGSDPPTPTLQFKLFSSH